MAHVVLRAVASLALRWLTSGLSELNKGRRLMPLTWLFRGHGFGFSGTEEREGCSCVGMSTKSQKLVVIKRKGVRGGSA